MKTKNKKRYFGWLFLLCIFPSLIFAAEPANLALAKQAVARYYDSGEYDRDVSKVAIAAQDYLAKRLRANQLNPKKLAVVFDIDDTLISNYPQVKARDFAQTRKDVDEVIGGDGAVTVPGMLKLFNFAKAHQVTVILVTGRPEKLRDHTVDQLKQAGYAEWDQLYLRSPDQKDLNAAAYKTTIRKNVEQQGYEVVLNIGDQYSDLTGGYADKTFKLPDPMYFIK
jgi:acid phosphatase